MHRVENPLEERVSNAISRSPYLLTRKLRHETHQGRVVLQGTVESFFQKQMAQETVRIVDGVEEVDNQLEVCWK